MEKIKKPYESAFYAVYGMYVFKTADNIIDRAYYKH